MDREDIKNIITDVTFANISLDEGVNEIYKHIKELEDLVADYKQMYGAITYEGEE